MGRSEGDKEDNERVRSEGTVPGSTQEVIKAHPPYSR